MNVSEAANIDGPAPQVKPSPAAAAAPEPWPVCALCGQSIWPSWEYHEMHKICEDFICLLPKGAKVKVTFQKKGVSS